MHCISYLNYKYWKFLRFFFTFIIWVGISLKNTEWKWNGFFKFKTHSHPSSEPLENFFYLSLLPFIFIHLKYCNIINIFFSDRELSLKNSWFYGCCHNCQPKLSLSAILNQILWSSAPNKNCRSSHFNQKIIFYK